MNGLDLFSGIGGLSIGLRKWVDTVAYCEQDRYAQGVLLSKMSEGYLDRAPIWDDVRTLSGSMLPQIDIIFGGFPCQDISCAGRGEGLAGERSGLFFEIIRLTKETRAPFVFLENVPAIRTRGLREVVRAFTDLRYDCRWTCVSAAEVGAPHLRKRWFMLAHAHGDGLRDGREWDQERETKTNSIAQYNGQEKPLADTVREGLENGRPSDLSEGNDTRALAELERCREPWWSVEPDVGRVVNGLSFRVDRLKCLGNAVVPFQAEKAFKKLLGFNS